MKSTFDIAIVGQGIAGTLMAWFLHQYGKKILIIDDHHQGASSVVAAGIVNPVTGKNYVTSWRFNEFLPKALETYQSLDDHFGIRSLTFANIIRSLYSPTDENTWLAKSVDTALRKYVCDKADLGTYDQKIHKQFAYGELKGTFYVNMSMIMDALKSQWIANDGYITQKFQYELLKKTHGKYLYKDCSFDKIVFCEGYKAIDNPFFNNIGLSPSKGEVLIVSIPDAGFTKMYKDGIFIVPLGGDTYWVGSSYEWNPTDDSPTKKNFELLSTELNRVLRVPFKILDHKAAIRPTMHNRRPIFKVHEQNEGMYLFNGLGTKGVSIGPFAAHQFARYIVEENPADLLLL